MHVANLLRRSWSVAQSGMCTAGSDLFHFPRRLRGWWRLAQHRISAAFALRGTAAMMVPFIVLYTLGRPYGGVFAALGGLYAVLADAGGAYQRRLGAMLLALTVGAVSLFIGERLPNSVWLAPLVLAAVAFASGMARVFGGSGISIGLCASILFLVGTLAPGGTVQAAESAGYYALGSFWVIVLQLALWRLRPYRVLLRQVAVCFDACDALVATLAVQPVGADPAPARRRIRRSHQAAREAIRTAEATLEALRIGGGHSTPFFDRVALLLAAASQEAAAAVSLRATDWPAPGTPAARAWRTLFASWRTALAAVAQAMLYRGHGAVSVTEMHGAFEVLEAHGVMTREARAPLRLALLHLDIAAESVLRFSGLNFTWRETLPRIGIGGLRDALRTLGAQLTFRSIIFRHALRVAVAAGFGLWVAGVFDVMHRMWLPMTTIIVLQPEFGATWQRMWQRVGGTLAGVLIAGGLYFVVHGSVAELAVIALFAYGTFLFIRSHYGVGVVMLTPMILLLLGVLMPSESASLIVARGVYTILGGALAFMAAYLLWPLWQRGAFLPQCVAAVRAQRDYLAAVFSLPADGDPTHPELMRVRHRAERESDNTDATLRRMLAEPPRARANVNAALGFMTYLRHLADNAVRFAVELAGKALSPGERRQGDELLGQLDIIADALTGKVAAEKLVAVRPLLATGAFAEKPLARWFERLSADTAVLAITARRLLNPGPRRPYFPFRRRTEEAQAKGSSG